MKLLFRLIGQRMKRHPREYTVMGIVLLIVTLLWIAEPLFSRYAIDTLLTIRDGKDVSLLWVFGWWGVLFLALSISQMFDKYLTWRMMNRTELGRSAELYEHVLQLDIGFHTGQKSGEVVKLIDEGAENLAELQRNMIVDLISSLAASVVFVIIGYTINPLLSTLLCVLICGYIVVVVIGTNKTMKFQLEANKAWVERIGRAYDVVTNISSVKSGAQEERELRHLERTNDTVFQRQMSVNRRWASVEAINFFMLTRIVLTALGVLLYVQGILSLGELYFFQASFFRVLTPFEILSGLVPFWNKKMGKVRLSEELLQTPIYVKSKKDAVILSPLRGHIQLDKACFSYEQKIKVFDTEVPATPSVPSPNEDHQSDDENPRVPAPTRPHLDVKEKEEEPIEHTHDREVLHDITLDIRAGEHIAFVGHSGAGKSTLALLLNRFYDVTKGRILVDGIDLRDVDLQWWRSQIGLVLQENIMFNDSILENIRYAKPGASREEVEEAARKAAAAEFIEPLPKGYDTLIGDRGIRLSGGQRQRVAIARAILKNPAIVVLDEATSALDSVTERQVQEGIKGLVEGRTACIIAHRLSTVRSVNRTAVFDKGRLIACAPHEELVRTCPIYKEMVELQSHGMLAE